VIDPLGQSTAYAGSASRRNKGLLLSVSVDYAVRELQSLKSLSTKPSVVNAGLRRTRKSERRDSRTIWLSRSHLGECLRCLTSSVTSTKPSILGLRDREI